jgi:hypothetical protein
VLLVLLAAASAPAFPQEPAAPPAEDVPAEAGSETDTEGEAAEVGDSATVERILEQQEALLRGARFSYEPQGRRDPFQSLYEVVNRPPEGQRPPGIRGMLVAELDLDGIVKDASGGDIAFFKGSDNKGYFLRVGDGVFDATLLAIDTKKGLVTFRQKVDDPRMIKPYRDVVMRLATMNEERPE